MAIGWGGEEQEMHYFCGRWTKYGMTEGCVSRPCSQGWGSELPWDPPGLVSNTASREKPEREEAPHLGLVWEQSPALATITIWHSGSVLAQAWDPPRR